MRAALTVAGVMTFATLQPPPASVPAAPVEWREEYHPNGAMKSRVQIRDGMRQGVEHRWHSNGRLAAVRTFANDVLHGQSRSWYADGSPYEERWYAGGQEAGAQRAYAPDGVMYLNYEMRNGRRFGMVNARPCLRAAEGM
jgi:antitoxin component YwqK of YwqJK toxin-antitoxin module